MKQLDFDDMMKNQMEELSQDDNFPFEERMWQDMAATMDEEGVLMPLKSNWAQIIPYSLLFLLFLSNGWLTWQYFQQEDRIEQHQTSFNQLSNQLETTNTELKKIETIVQNHRNDTITLAPTHEIHTEYKVIEKVIEKIIYAPQNGNNSFGDTKMPYTRIVKPNSISNNGLGKPLLSKHFFSDEYWNNRPLKQGSSNLNITTYSFSEELLNNNNSINDFTENINTSETTVSNKQENEIIEVKASELTNLEIIALQELDYENTPLDTTVIANLIDSNSFERKLAFRDYFERVRYATEVSDVGVGLTTSTDFSFQNTDYTLSTMKYGISSQLNFSDRIKISTDILWKQTQGELNNIETLNYPDNYFDSYPEIGGRSSDDILHKIELKDQDIEIALYAKYMFLPKKKISPYIGGGVKASYHYNTALEYYYLTAPDFLEEYETGITNVPINSFGVNTASVLLGLEYDIIPKITIRLDGMYNKDINSHRFNNTELQWFSGNLGILYNLNFN